MNKTTTSKKPNSLEVLRKLIREEVKTAIREEMVPILLEVIKNKPLSESTVPAPVNLPFTPPTRSNTANTSNPVNILEETRREMLGRAGMPDADEFTTLLSANTGNMSSLFRETTTIAPQSSQQPKDVSAMLSTARKSTKEENVEITDVPDFSNLVKKMNL